MYKKKPKQNKGEITKSIAGHYKIYVVPILGLISLSLVANVVQAISYFNLKSEADNISASLTNYRELQTTQIKAVREACSTLKNDVNNADSDRNLVKGGLALLSNGMANAYTSIVLQTCYAPLFSISGVLFLDDIDSSNMDDLVLEPDSNFDIREDAFDKVRW